MQKLQVLVVVLAAAAGAAVRGAHLRECVVVNSGGRGGGDGRGWEGKFLIVFGLGGGLRFLGWICSG